MIIELDDSEVSFPDPRKGEPDGFFAVGGELSVQRLALAYSRGIFPWFAFEGAMYIKWWCPQDRFVIFPAEIHVSHSMRTLLNKDEYQYTINKDFDSVILNCSSLRIHEEGAWLGSDMVAAYTELHRRGYASSVEVWKEGELVGGLYGVVLNGCFFGESMFSFLPNGSKLALIYLAREMSKNGGKLIDCQFETPHLKSMGGRHISYADYLQIVNEPYARKLAWMDLSLADKVKHCFGRLFKF